MKLKENVEPVCSSDTLYDLFYGGYIKLEDFLVDSEEVENAMRIIGKFISLLEDNELLETI